MAPTTFNPNAAAFVPPVKTNVYGGQGSYHTRGSHVKPFVPTAKVPNYVKRLAPTMRDAKPGLLPTPDMPPMRPCTGSSFSFDGEPMFDGSYTHDAYSMCNVNMGYGMYPLEQAPPGFEQEEAVSVDTTTIDLVDSLLLLLAGSTNISAGMEEYKRTSTSETAADSEESGSTSFESDSDLNEDNGVAGFFLPSSLE